VSPRYIKKQETRNEGERERDAGQEIATASIEKKQFLGN
jgi:hypothetical protein